MKIKKQCTECESEDVLFDAYVKWDYEKQQYIIDDVYPKAFCNVCIGECQTFETEIEEDGKSDN
jgi:peroxiredoxin